MWRTRKGTQRRQRSLPPEPSAAYSPPLLLAHLLRKARERQAAGGPALAYGLGAD